MDAVAFLAGAVVVILLGVLVIALRHRPPKGHDLGIRSFQREMRALSPEARQAVVERAGLRVVERPPAGED